MELTRRAVLTGVAGTAATGMTTSAAFAGTRGNSARPNVLWIITDDQPRRLVTHMQSVMDRIAGRGARFTRGYAAVPWCGPARASMLTSRYPGNHLCADNDTHRRFVEQGHDQDTVATRMAAAGYRNGYFGKYMNGDQQDAGYVAPGWDRWVVNYSRTDLFCVDGTLRQDPTSNNDQYAADRCRRFIRGSVDRPWFAVFAPTAPHDPFTTSPEHADDYDGVTWHPESFNEVDMSDKPSWMHGIPMRTREKMRTMYEGKLEEQQDTDDQIDMLLTALQETGQLSNTYVFMVSDNGYLLGEHRLFRKEQPYEESSGIPFLVRGPGVVPGLPGPLVSQVDLMPTTLAVAGLDPDAGRVLDGRSMLANLHSGDWSDWRKRLLVENLYREWAMLREGSTAYIDHYGRGEDELYDLRRDPWQMSSQASVVDTSELRARLHAMRRANGMALRELESA